MDVQRKAAMPLCLKSQQSQEMMGDVYKRRCFRPSGIAAHQRTQEPVLIVPALPQKNCLFDPLVVNFQLGRGCNAKPVIGLHTIGLVMNQRGAERALETDIDQLGAITLCSDTFAQKNQGQTARETLQVASDIIRRARKEGRTATVMISSAFG